MTQGVETARGAVPLARLGVTQAQIGPMMVENPKRLRVPRL